MKTDFLKKLCCPFDKADLAIQVFQLQDDEIREGILTCTCCKRYFPIVQGIPVMSPDEYREKSLELPILERWGIHESLEVKSFSLTEANSERDKKS